MPSPPRAARVWASLMHIECFFGVVAAAGPGIWVTERTDMALAQVRSKGSAKPQRELACTKGCQVS